MFIEKLRLIEISTQNKIREEQNKLGAIVTILKLLDEIDYSAEIIPEEDPGRVKKLLVSLKGGPLSEDETILVHEIVRGLNGRQS